MESRDSLPVLTGNEFDFPTLKPLTLGHTSEPLVDFLSPLSITILSNSRSPDAQPDTVSTTQGLSSFTVCSTPTVTTDQLQPLTNSSPVRDARAKISSSHNARARSKRRLRRMQQHVNKDYDNRCRLTVAQQHKREHFARLARTVKCARFNLNLNFILRPEYSSWKLLFWDNYRQELTIQNTLVPSHRLVVPLRAITANSQQ